VAGVEALRRSAVDGEQPEEPTAPLGREESDMAHESAADAFPAPAGVHDETLACTDRPTYLACRDPCHAVRRRTSVASDDREARVALPRRPVHRAGARVPGSARPSSRDGIEGVRHHELELATTAADQGRAAEERVADRSPGPAGRSLLLCEQVKAGEGRRLLVPAEGGERRSSDLGRDVGGERHVGDERPYVPVRGRGKSLGRRRTVQA
jgi:hypothetical protein